MRRSLRESAVRLPPGTDPTGRSAIEAVAGPVGAIEVEPLETNGFSGSRHERIRAALRDGGEKTYVLKRTNPTLDFTCVLSGAARSREVALLEATELRAVWSVFHSPYVAFTESNEGEGCVLMEDLAAHLFPDAREPLAESDEHLLLRSLARLHARFWGRRPDAAAPWLASSATFCSLLGADRVGDDAWEAVLPASIRSGVVAGWREAMRRMPDRVAERLRLPRSTLHRRRI